MITAALDGIMGELAAAPDAASFAARWESAPAPFAAVAVDDWDEHVVGGAELVFADAERPSIAELEAAFGAFGAPPSMPSGTRFLRGEWWREGMPVRVVLLVYSPPGRDAPLERLVLQRGSSRPD